jgi:hypothetical protein
MPIGFRFNASDFLSRLNVGEFDSRIMEEIAALSDDQAEELALLLVEHHKKAEHFFYTDHWESSETNSERARMSCSKSVVVCFS